MTERKKVRKRKATSPGPPASFWGRNADEFWRTTRHCLDSSGRAVRFCLVLVVAAILTRIVLEGAGAASADALEEVTTLLRSHQS
ncbi:hypothetical protein SAMN05443668_110300 [Cryptosporangium aurantiacum]|uniref:Uncharacterized protein n=1 Tax=Cryptosporangium aurantiacum TaxID=134849 RepID=A0A1M7REI3_9ACTN|nr:hypothetical protein SAMN05443668_110300 [Cryptosporangium aurantiacum]